MPPITRKGVYKRMRKRTTTRQIQNVIKNNLLTIAKAEVYHKTSRNTEVIPNDKFLECFDFLCESGIFVDAIGWHFEKDYKSDIYGIECSRMNGSVDIIVTAYLRKNGNTTDEEIEEALLFEELEG